MISENDHRSTSNTSSMTPKADKWIPKTRREREGDKRRILFRRKRVLWSRLTRGVSALNNWESHCRKNPSLGSLRGVKIELLLESEQSTEQKNLCPASLRPSLQALAFFDRGNVDLSFWQRFFGGGEEVLRDLKWKWQSWWGIKL